MIGTSGRQRVPTDSVERYEFQMPTLDKQVQIAEILSSLDEKIELNRRMNKTLEAIGQALFKHWFVDNPEKENWPVGQISDLGKVVTGKTPPKAKRELFGDSMPFLKIPDMHNQAIVFSTEDGLSEEGINFQAKKTIPKGSTCVSCIATVGLVSLAGKDLQTNQQINSIVPVRQYYKFHNFFIIKTLSDQIRVRASGGSATLNLNKLQFEKIPVQLPPDQLLQKFDSVMSPIMDLLEENLNQVNNLKDVRDSLLPRLMSGKLVA